MTRGMLVFNPHATTTDEALRRSITRRLETAMDLSVAPTKQRGHAVHLVAGAVHDGVDVVFSLGGDGTANEVLQALPGTGVMLGVIPGGGTNVLARALGLPNDATAATERLLRLLRGGRRRRISLGQAGERYFAFNAGFGFDAAAVRRVEQSPRLKRRLRQAAFVWLALREWFGGPDAGRPAVRIQVPGGEPTGPYVLAVVSNTDPYTYLGPLPLRVTPGARLDPQAGLEAVGVHPVGTAAMLRIVAQVLAPEPGRHLAGGAVDHRTDVRRVALLADRPRPLMVDGDYAGEHERVDIRAVPDALDVLA